MTRQLNETLFELIGGLDQADASVPLTVESVEIRAPMTMSWRLSNNRLLLMAAPPATAYRTGIEPVVHPLRITAVSAGNAYWPVPESETGHAGQN